MFGADLIQGILANTEWKWSACFHPLVFTRSLMCRVGLQEACKSCAVVEHIKACCRAGRLCCGLWCSGAGHMQGAPNTALIPDDASGRWIRTLAKVSKVLHGVVSKIALPVHAHAVQQCHRMHAGSGAEVLGGQRRRASGGVRAGCPAARVLRLCARARPLHAAPGACERRSAGD